MAATEAARLPILRLQPDDAESVWPLSVEAGWNQLPADWRLMIASGSALGIRNAAGKWIATALALPLGSQTSWISMVLVTEPERGKGHGLRLLRRCIDLVEATGRSMGLDATEFGRPIYLPLGFRDVYALSRWSAPAVSEARVAAPAGIAIRPTRPQDLAMITRYDRQCSGLERGAVLENLLFRAPAVAHVAQRGDGSIAGYSLGRDGRRATHVGPVVAEDQAIGLALLSRALARVHGPAILDVPDQHETIRQWLQSLGASAPRTFMRMLRGAAPAIEDASRIMALAGPELA
jgi:GNAT superfamily N-acetyltransferase